MRMEPRYTMKDGERKMRSLLFVASGATRKLQSSLLDQLFGKTVAADGTIGPPARAICKLADGYAEHYVELTIPEPCKMCGGERYIKDVGRPWIGFYVKCPECNGEK